MESCTLFNNTVVFHSKALVKVNDTQNCHTILRMDIEKKNYKKLK